MADTGTMARPYAVAAFKQAQEEGRVSEWAQMLDLLTLVVNDPVMKGLIANPKVNDEQLAALVIDVCGERLSQTGANLVRVLAEYKRLGITAQVRDAFQRERAKVEGRSEVRVRSAYPLEPDQERVIAQAVSRRLGVEVDLSVEVDQSLIGGVVVRAGDLVIDASLRGRLGQLARALG